MNPDEVRIHRLAKFDKLTPLYVDFSDRGKLRLKRWRPNQYFANDKPNAIAITDLPANSIAVIDGKSPGVFEVRMKGKS